MAAAGKPAAVSPNAPTGKTGWSRRNFAPVLFLEIEGKDASDLLRLCFKFSHKETMSKPAETTWEFRNDNRKLLDDPRLFPNRRWRFRFGFFDDMSPIIEGSIKEVAPEYADKRTVKIVLSDGSAGLGSTSSQKNWGTITSSDIAKQIARKHGLKAIVEESKDKPKKAFIQPGSVNDLQYLRDLAAMIDFELFVAGSPPVLYYRKKPYDAPPHRELIYYDDPTQFYYVKNFKPKIDTKGSQGASGASGTDKGKGAGKDAKNKDTGKDPALSKKVVSIVGDDGGATTIPASRQNDKGITKPSPGGGGGGIAAAARSQQLDKVNEATSDHPLTPSIERGKMYLWSGIEKQLSGRWYCHEVSHEISGTGASTKATWKRNSQGAGGPGDKDAKNKNKKDAKDAGKGAPAVSVIGDTGSATYLPAGATKGSK